MIDPATIVGLQTAWRRSGLLVLLGTVVALVAFGTTAYEANENARRARLQAERAQMERNLAAQQRKDLEKQISELRTALTASRSAIAAFHQQDYATALKFYDQALAADPDDAYLLNLRAYTLFKQHKYDDALAEELRSVRADPNYAWGYFDLARFQCALGRRDDARDSITKALGLNPDLRDIMRGDGEFRRLCGGIVP
jgi:tetratricopeptide (TPR) repeat protein